MPSHPTETSEKARDDRRVGAWSIAQLMREGDLLGRGPIGALERRLAEHYGMDYALCVSSATAGLHALAVALELRGAEVVTSPYGWGAGVGALLSVGARIAFADIDPLTLALSPESAARLIGSRTRALFTSDLFGVPADDRALRALADAHGLLLVHDGAQSFGASRDGRPAGQLAHATVLSFGPGKGLSAGEGGAILTSSARLHRRLVALTQHALRQKLELRLAAGSELTLHARMHPLAAAWALADFDEALNRVSLRQRRAAEVLARVAELGVCEPQDYAGSGLVPSFPRVTAAWSRQPAPQRLEQHLQRTTGRRWFVSAAPVHWIPDDPRFPGQQVTARCGRLPVSRRQLAHRFTLEEEVSR